MGRPGTGVLEVQQRGGKITGIRLGGSAVQTLNGTIEIDQ
jgi:hypothetical protein